MFSMYVDILTRVTILLDGYTDCNKNTKAVERRQTTTTSSSFDVMFDEFMTVPTSKQKFLANITTSLGLV